MLFKGLKDINWIKNHNKKEKPKKIIYHCKHCGELSHDTDIGIDDKGNKFCHICGHGEKLEILEVVKVKEVII